MKDLALDLLARMEHRLAEARARRRWARLRALGMQIGHDVVLPPSTWIDVAHCYLISIGDGCRFGPQCLILAHDAQMDEFLDAGRLGRVVIGAGCRIGARSVILCNVEIGSGTVVEAGSVVSASLPPASYCAGSPARAVCSVTEYVERITKATSGHPPVTLGEIRDSLRRPEDHRELLEQLARGVLVSDAGATTPNPIDDRPLSP